MVTVNMVKVYRSKHYLKLGAAIFFSSWIAHVVLQLPLQLMQFYECLQNIKSIK